jgi:shikimate dehydrogenase
MFKLYKTHMIKHTNWIIGYPLTHTQSPVLHNKIYEYLNLNACLVAQANEQLGPLIENIKKRPIALTAVTMPFKEKVIDYLDVCSAEVEQLQAANTIIQKENKLYGHNTDIDGIAYALRDTVLLEKNVLIIGAGGAACALAYVLKKEKAHLFWFNRTPEKALALIRQWGGELVDLEQIHTLNFDVIINTTPLGLYPHTNATPFPQEYLHSEQAVFDMVYNPYETLLLKQAKQAGALCISGLDMFIGQALRQIELWQEQSFDFSAIIDPIRTLLIQKQNRGSHETQSQQN